MDKIILLILFTIIGSVTKGHAQLRCFVCTNCPNVDELDSSMVQTCGTPDDADTTTDPEITTATPDTTDTPETTAETDPIITQTNPNEPPTTTPQPDVTVTTETSDGEFTTQTIPITPPTTTPQTPVSPPALLGHKYRDIMRELVGDYQCFYIRRQVGDTTQVNRGCVATNETKDQTCLDANSGVDPEFCRVCAYDECNLASKYAVSLLVVLSSLFVVSALR